MKIKLLVILLLTLSSRAFSQSLYYPSTTWQTTDPSSLGWCTSEIDSLYAFLQKGDSKAFVLLKDGKIVLEKYFGTFTQDSLWYWASAGKTLTAFAVG
ncbi:MAG: serine hydrolase, partial [Bacteroidia bacterium]